MILSQLASLSPEPLPHVVESILDLHSAVSVGPANGRMQLAYGVLELVGSGVKPDKLGLLGSLELLELLEFIRVIRVINTNHAFHSHTSGLLRMVTTLATMSLAAMAPCVNFLPGRTAQSAGVGAESNLLLIFH